MTKSNSVELTVGQVAREDVFSDIVRVHYDHRRFAKAGRVILVQCKGKSIPAVARGALKNSRTGIWLDLRCREKLGLKPNDRETFSFRKAGLRDEICWAWNATDAMPRIAARLGAVSVALGFLGLMLGAWSLGVTLFS